MISPDVSDMMAARLDDVERALQALGSKRDNPAAHIHVFRENILFSGVYEPFRWSVRMRWEFFQVVSDVFDRFTLRIGSASYRFATNGTGHDNIFNIPFVIDPGIDVVFDPDAAGNLFLVYVVAYPDS